MTDERGARPPQPVLRFPAPPTGLPTGPLRVVGMPPLSATLAAGPTPAVTRPVPPSPTRH